MDLFERMLHSVCDWLDPVPDRQEATKPDVTDKKSSIIEEDTDKTVSDCETKEYDVYTSKFCQDILALQIHFGSLKDKTIKISLHELLCLAPRRRKRRDSYKGLQKDLLDKFNCTLVITTSRKK